MTSPEPHKADSTAGLAALTPKLQALAKLLDVKSVLVMRSEFDSMVVKHFEEQQMWRGLPHRLPGLHTSYSWKPGGLGLGVSGRPSVHPGCSLAKRSSSA